MSPLPNGLFLKFLLVVRYHRDMKILKILVSNFKHFRIYGTFLKMANWHWTCPGSHFKYFIFFDNFCFKQPLVLIYLGMFFDSRNSKMASQLLLNLLVLGCRQAYQNLPCGIYLQKKMWR